MTVTIAKADLDRMYNDLRRCGVCDQPAALIQITDAYLIPFCQRHYEEYQ